jgi:hypothetical protein
MNILRSEEERGLGKLEVDESIYYSSTKIIPLSLL